MSITAKDSLFETAAGVAILSHTPSGAGATGGAWSKPSATTGLVSKAGGGFTGPGTSISGTCALGAAVAVSGYVQVDVTYGGPHASFQGARATAFKALGTSGDYYAFGLSGPVTSLAPSWTLFKQIDGVSDTNFGTIAGPALAVGTLYTVRMEWTVSGASVSFVCYVNGTNVGTGTDSGAVDGTAAYNGSLIPGISDYSGDLLRYDNFLAGSLLSFGPGSLTAGTVTSTSIGLTFATDSGGSPPYSNQLQRSASGAGTFANVAGQVFSGASGSFTDSTVAAGTTYDYRVQVTDNASTVVYSATLSVTSLTFIAANNAGFNYTGRWGGNGSAMETMSNGADCRFSYTGQTCGLSFNVAGVVKYPIIAYWIDGTGPARALLDSTGAVTITPAYNTAPSGTPPFATVRSNVHDVRFMANIESEYPTLYDNYTNHRDNLKFTGVALNAGGALLTAVPCQDTIEFLGDSITGSLGLLYTASSGYSSAVAAPEIGWPEKVSQFLGLRAAVNGHGGQGITTAGTDGTPIANSAFGFVYAGTAWNPAYKPRVVIVYQGTNDGSITTNQYQTYLSTIRTAYPAAWIFAVVPYQKPAHITPIQAAVTNLADGKIVYRDYSAAFTVNTDTSDGTHFNPGGAVRMAAKLAGDIRASVPTIAGGGNTYPVIGSSFIRGL